MPTGLQIAAKAGELCQHCEPTLTQSAHVLLRQHSASPGPMGDQTRSGRLVENLGIERERVAQSHGAVTAAAEAVGLRCRQPRSIRGSEAAKIIESDLRAGRATQHCRAFLIEIAKEPEAETIIWHLPKLLLYPLQRFS